MMPTARADAGADGRAHERAHDASPSPRRRRRPSHERAHGHADGRAHDAAVARANRRALRRAYGGADGCADVRPIHNTDGRADGGADDCADVRPVHNTDIRAHNRPDDAAVAAALAGPDGLLPDPARVQEDVHRRLAVRRHVDLHRPRDHCLDVDGSRRETTRLSSAGCGRRATAPSPSIALRHSVIYGVRVACTDGRGRRDARLVVAYNAPAGAPSVPIIHAGVRPDDHPDVRADADADAAPRRATFVPTTPPSSRPSGSHIESRRRRRRRGRAARQQRAHIRPDDAAAAAGGTPTAPTFVPTAAVATASPAPTGCFLTNPQTLIASPTCRPVT